MEQLNTNLLVHGTAAEQSEINVELFKIMERFAWEGFNAFYFTTKPLETIPYQVRQQLGAHIMRQIIFGYVTTEELIKALQEISTWTKAPRLIIIHPLQEFFKQPLTVDVIHKNALLFATLQNSIETLSKKLKVTCTSIVSIDADVYSSILPQMVSLYYYRENSFIDLNYLRLFREKLSLRKQPTHKRTI